MYRDVSGKGNPGFVRLLPDFGGRRSATLAGVLSRTLFKPPTSLGRLTLPSYLEADAALTAQLHSRWNLRKEDMRRPTAEVALLRW